MSAMVDNIENWHPEYGNQGKVSTHDKAGYDCPQCGYSIY